MADVNPTSFPISLRTWPKEDSNAESLGDLIYRINIERKGFRHVSEGQLQQEIKDEESGISRDDEDDSEEESKEEDEKGSKGFIAKKRAEMIGLLQLASTEAQTGLDTLSLLESKYIPTAKSTMSPSLKDNLPSAVMSYDKWDMSKQDTKRLQDEAVVASGSTMDSLTSAADSLLKAATRLQEDVKRETQYWEQVLSLHNEGWPVFKVPGEQRTIVVQFSATEAGPLFKERGLAALRANKNGTIKLDQRLTMKPKMLRVRLAQDGAVKGTSGISSQPSFSGLDVPLEQVVRRAQDSLFDEELYQEMAMESRILQPLGVGLRGAVIHLPTSLSSDGKPKEEWLVDLVSLDDPPEEDLPPDDKSRMVATLFRLLLSHLYRQRLQRRSRIPPPLSDRKPLAEVTSIIRPVMALWHHFNAYGPLYEYISKSSMLLQTAGFAVLTDTAQTPALSSILKALGSATNSKKQTSAIDVLMQQISRTVQTPLSFSPASTTQMPTTEAEDASLKIELRTNLFSPLIGTEYILHISPSYLEVMNGTSSPSFMQKTRLIFTTLSELKLYISNLLEMDIVHSVLAPKHPDWEHDEEKPELRKIGEVGGKRDTVGLVVRFREDRIVAISKWVNQTEDLFHRAVWEIDGKEKKALVDEVAGWMED